MSADRSPLQVTLDTLAEQSERACKEVAAAREGFTRATQELEHATMAYELLQKAREHFTRATQELEHATMAYELLQKARAALDNEAPLPVLTVTRAVVPAANEDCRCDQSVGICRIHDVGR